MPLCHPLPRCWLFTDARAAGHGIGAARRLPPHSGIVGRMDGLGRRASDQLWLRLRRIAQARRLVLLIAASDAARAYRLGAAGVHLRGARVGMAGRARRLGLISSAPVHNRAEARAARRSGVDIAFISPLYPTQSHPGARVLRHRAWIKLARAAAAQPIALGGMNPARFRMLQKRCVANGLVPGWAAIDAWENSAAARRQKRNCVPT